MGARGRDMAASVRNLFRGSHEFSLCDSARNRADLEEIALACSEHGRLKLRWTANESDIDSWVHEMAAGGTKATFRLWAEMQIFDRDFMERHKKLGVFAQSSREKALEIGNRDLDSVFDKLDDAELLRCFIIYNIISIEQVIFEPSVRVNILFATDSEKLNNFSLIHEAGRGTRDYDSWGNSISDNAFNLLLESQGASLGEVLENASDVDVDAQMEINWENAHDKLIARASHEVADMRDSSQALLIVCSEATPDQLFQILNSPYVQIGRGARIGIYNPWENTVSRLQMSLEKNSAALPSDLIYDVQIEGSPLRCSMDFICNHKHKFWRNLVKSRSK